MSNTYYKYIEIRFKHLSSQQNAAALPRFPAGFKGGRLPPAFLPFRRKLQPTVKKSKGRKRRLPALVLVSLFKIRQNCGKAALFRRVKPVSCPFCTRSLLRQGPPHWCTEEPPRKAGSCCRRSAQHLLRGLFLRCHPYRSRLPGCPAP